MPIGNNVLDVLPKTEYARRHAYRKECARRLAQDYKQNVTKPKRLTLPVWLNVVGQAWESFLPRGCKYKALIGPSYSSNF